MSINLEKQIEELGQLVYVGKFKEALKIVAKLEKKSELIDDQLLNLLRLKAQTLHGLGKYKEAIMSIDILLEKSKKLDNHLMELNAILNKSFVLWKLGQLKEGLSLIKEGEQIIDKSPQLSTINYDNQFCMLKILKGVHFMYLGKIDESKNLFYDSLPIAEKLQNKLLIGYCYMGLTVVHYEGKDPKLGIEFGKKALIIFEEIGNQQEIAQTLNALSMSYNSIGDLKEAEKCLKRALEISEKNGLKRDIHYFLHNLASSYRERGDLDLALEYFEKAYELQLKTKGLLHEHRTITSIGNIYHKKGDFEKAFEYYQKAQRIRESLDNKPDIANGLFHLITLAIDMGNIEEAKKLLEQLKQISNELDVGNINEKYRLSHALLLKTSIRVRDRGKAEELLLELVEDESSSLRTTKIALINLCELLLNELRLSGNPDILSEINLNINKLLKIAELENSYALFAEIYWLQAQMALIDLDTKKAKKLLTKARKITEEKGLTLLGQEIVNEQKKLEEQFGLWEELGKQKAPVSKTIQHINPEKTVKRMHRETTSETPKEDAVLTRTKLFTIKI